MSEANTEKWRSPGFIAGVIFLCAVLLALVFAGQTVMRWLQDEQKVPLKQVLVSGELTQLSAKEIDKAVRNDTAVSLFAIDVDDAHQAIESLPWVYQASIRKSWPDTLKVYVVEQVAVAHWNEDMLLNQYGGVFDAFWQGDELPSLYGPGGSELTVLQGLKAMQGLLNGSDLTITEVSLSERYAWHLKLSNDIQLRLGRTEFIDRLQRFIDVYPLLLKNEKAVAYVDLRYDTGLAVGWREKTPS
ncbi:cell division protein FtsQ/DivIB [Planctobacterium marinum]|uniref:cell division protein FtsQ/DivIB n=1 Tax=Planctobacterium marinum TaxID=1631968 RepID=UPI001E2F5D75|nr:cell division protein FtsQ/DivIB [Planctobacterium marinum]MCC2605391.1 cell division protein FtsQ/DivIB [Planctobacterium marinum]